MKLITSLCSVLYFHLFVRFSHANKDNHCVTRNVRIESASLALTSMMRELNHLSFQIVIVKNDSYLDKLVTSLLNRLGNWSIPVKLIRINDMTDFIYFYGVSYVTLSREEIIYMLPYHRGDDIGQLEDIVNVKRSMNSYKDSIFMNYAYELDSNQMKKKIDTHNSHQNFQLVHLSNCDASLQLFNFLMFLNANCEKGWKSVNVFDAVRHRWKVKSKFIQKFRNFNKCKIVFIAQQTLNKDFDKIFSIKIIKGSGYELSGMVGETLEELARYYNFSALPIQLDDNSSPLEFFFFLLQQLSDNDPFMAKLHLTPPLFFVPHTFVVTRGLAFTPMEKMVLPFDYVTWLLVLSSIAIGYVVIFTMTQSSREAQNFVFGRDIRYPYFNILQIFFGIGLIRVPGRNFARFFMVLFTLYCLVIRTAYQSKMFEQITGNVRRPTPESVAELLMSDYPILVSGIGALSSNE